MSEKLLPCPFCGGKAIVRERFVHGIANKKNYRSECAECHASFLNWYKNVDKAIAAWNRRAEKKEDLPPVVRGEWIVEATDPSNVYAYCSECREFIDVIKTELSVCPNCGAKMKEDK